MTTSGIDRRTTATVLLVFVLAFAAIVSAALAAPPPDRRKPASAAASHSDQSPAKQCKAERVSMGESAFAQKHGTNANLRNAFGKCVSARAKAKNPEKTKDAKLGTSGKRSKHKPGKR